MRYRRHFTNANSTLLQGCLTDVALVSVNECCLNMELSLWYRRRFTNSNSTLLRSYLKGVALRSANRGFFQCGIKVVV